MANDSTLFTPAQWRKAQDYVSALKVEFPEFSRPRLLRQIIKSACLKAGATGAGTTAVGLIPGFGKMLGWAVNLAGDAAMTAAIQRDLVLRIFALHERTPSDRDQQEMALWIGTVGVGAMEAVEQLGGGILKGIATKVLGKVLRRGLPVLEVVGSSATHVVATYMLARKVNVYCGEIEASVDEMDPRRLRNWTMLSLGTVVDEDEPKTVKDAFRE